jgi:hypothetical protein
MENDRAVATWYSMPEVMADIRKFKQGAQGCFRSYGRARFAMERLSPAPHTVREPGWGRHKCRAHLVYTEDAVAFAGHLVDKLLKLWKLSVRVAGSDV